MEISHFKLRLNPENIQESIKPVLSQIRPEWNLNEVKFKQFDEGTSNMLVGLQHAGFGCRRNDSFPSIWK